MKQELHDLNERFYALYGRLYENSELLTREQSEYMAKKLLEQYKDEYELLELKESVERARLMYALRLKRGYLSPRTWRFLLIFKRKYNFAAELLNREVNEEVQNLYAAQEAAIEKLHRQLMDEEVSGFSDDDEAEEGEEETPESPGEADTDEGQDDAEQSEEAMEPAGDDQTEEDETEPEEVRDDEEPGEEAEPDGGDYV